MEYTYIGCCVGAYYHAVIDKVREKYKLNFISDRKLENDGITEYDGIEVIPRAKIKEIENTVVIIFAYDLAVKNSLMEELQRDGVKFIFATEIIGEIGSYTGKEIKASGSNGKFQSGSNIVIYDDTMPDNITISFGGGNSKVVIGKNLIVSRLSVNMGNDAECVLGDNIQIVGAEFDVSYANLRIGNDCLFARDIILRTHDGHPIFDKTSGTRINYARDVVVGNHVWLCANAKLMSGAKIGDGSVVAAMALTSSEFPSNVVIAGIPAKVIRENIVWSKDTTVFFDFDNFLESKKFVPLRS